MLSRPLCLLLLLCSACAQPEVHRSPEALIVIVDGLRPEYVTPAIMPRLSAFRDSGYEGLAHHAVFPTVTRVNSSSLSTGSYPQTHGLTGNSMYVPQAADRVLSTGEKSDLDMLEDAMSGQLLTTPTLAEILGQHGKIVFASSSGSSGSGYLMNYRPGAGGLVHYEYILPDSLKPVVEALVGAAPEEDQEPKINLIRYAINSLLQVGIDHIRADALLLWITEPDGTAHARGIGAPETIAALNDVDQEIGRLFDELERRGLLSKINIFFTADHGFSTHTGTQSLENLLIEQGLKQSATSTDVVLAGGAIHVNEDKASRIPRIIQLLQQTEWVGPVFTRDGEMGTLAYSTIFWDHERSADILAAYNWNAASNEHGYPGSVASPGVAGHGSTSPYDIRTFFAISGPEFKRGIKSKVPSSNVDLAPTVLHLLDLPLPTSMDGRVLEEALLSGLHPDSVDIRTEVLRTEADGYTLMLDRSVVNGIMYIDGTRVER